MYPTGLAPGPLARELTEGPAGLLLPILAGITLGIAVACLVGQPPWGDQSLYLVAAGKALDGARFGRDIVDVNPPLILWLSGIPVAVARLLGVLPQVAMQALIGLMTAGLLVWCMRLARQTVDEEGAEGETASAAAFAWWLPALLLYATTIHPWYHVGTREHLLLLMMLPYLFMAWRRIEGLSRPSMAQALSAGLLAIGGCGLKPQHLLIVAAVELLVLLRGGGLRGVVRPEIIAMLAGGAAYCAAIVVFAPEYLNQVVPFAVEAYLDRAAKEWRELLSPSRALKIGIALAGWLLLRRWSDHRGLADVFMVAGIGALAAYFLQRKGYEYHLVPALACFHLGLGVSVVGFVTQRLGSWFSPGMAPATRFTVALTLLTAVITGSLYYPDQVTRAATAWSDARNNARKALTAHIPRGTTVFMLSSSVGGIHDDILLHGLNWGSRFTVLFMTQALLTRDLKSPKELDLARWTLDGMVEDLERYKPSLVIVDRCDDPAYPPCMELQGKRPEVLPWFLQDPSFNQAWSRYQLARRIGPFELWCAADDMRACDSVLAAQKAEIAPPIMVKSLPVE